MAVLSQSQVRTFAILGGLPNPDLMAAIAMAESGGNTDAIGAVGEVGLWQINQPVHVKAHPTWTVAYLKNPANNASAARTVYNSQGLGAWTAYTNGSYRRFLSTQQLSAITEMLPGGQNVGGVIGGVGGVVGGVVDAGQQIGRLAQAAAKAGNWISTPGNWVRIAYVIMGGAAIVASLVMIQSGESLKLGRQALGVAGNFVGGKGKAAARAAGKVAA